MYERPLHLKRSLERLVVAELPKERHAVVRLPLPRVTEKLPATEPLLPLDGLCRPYLVSFVRWDGRGLLWDDTIYQVWQLVDDYCKHSKGRYPLEIVLCAQRYFVRRCNRFYPIVHYARPIPFKYEEWNAPYEILVRGVV